MILDKPDLSFGLQQLKKKIEEFKKIIDKKRYWYVREEFNDLGKKKDPQYIIWFTDHVDDEGSDTADPEVYCTAHAGIRFSYLTFWKKNDSTTSYWQYVHKNVLNDRLNRFLEMYKSDNLQPPGEIKDWHNPKNKNKEHEMFKNKRFLYLIGYWLQGGTEFKRR